MALDFSEIAERLGSAPDLPAVQETVRTAARELTGAHGSTVVLRDGDFCFYADEDAISPLWKGQRFPITQCISGWAMLHGDCAVAPDVYTDPRIPIAAYRPTFVKSLAVAPIGAGHPSGAMGAIGVYWAVRHVATDAEVAALEELCSLTAGALDRLAGAGLGADSHITRMG